MDPVKKFIPNVITEGGSLSQRPGGTEGGTLVFEGVCVKYLVDEGLEAGVWEVSSHRGDRVRSERRFLVCSCW